MLIEKYPGKIRRKGEGPN